MGSLRKALILVWLNLIPQQGPESLQVCQMLSNMLPASRTAFIINLFEFFIASSSYMLKHIC
jgi:hypothetical protein